jgi:hypothetical protein
MRDARISTIYEGTTGIQANDLVGRKIGREQGRTALALLAEVDKSAAELKASGDANLAAIGSSIAVASGHARETVAWVATTFATNPAAPAAGSVYTLKLLGITLGGWLLGRSAQIAAKSLATGQGDAAFLRAKQQTARFFADHILPQAAAHAAAATRGAESVLATDEAML